MARAIYTVSDLTAATAALGMWGKETGTVGQEVIDGDTINVQADGNLGVRFLGVDAPEKSSKLPDEFTNLTSPELSDKFINLDSPKWEEFLTDPFAGLSEFKGEKYQGLVNFLKAHVGPGAALNHYQYAEAAHRALEEEVSKDIEALDKCAHSFRFFLAFAYEIMDRYGRLLGYVNCYEKNSDKRPVSYNERLLQNGVVSPYFIWPNVDPWRAKKPLYNAVVEPFNASNEADKGKLGDARRWVKAARKNRDGIFNPDNPLRLQAFEIRFLGRGTPPDRYVIDLSTNDNVIVKPEDYYTIPNVEDRLFVPAEYIPLFVKKGWQQP